MISVALIGPDGAGKTTIGRRLERCLSMPARYLYMGVNLEASSLMLPTTRLALALKRARGGRPDMVASSDPRRGVAKARPKGPTKQAVAGVKAGLRTANWLAEEWFRQAVAWSYLKRGYTVIFDRHFFADYYAYDVAGEARQSSLARRVHGYVLERYYPRPDLVICLDAPAEVLFARKGEGDLAWLDARRQEYLAMRDQVAHFAVVDVDRPIDEVVADVAAEIERFHRAAGSRPRVQESLT